MSVKEFNSTAPYLFDLNSSLSYTYVDGKNQVSTVTANTALGTNSVKLKYGDILDEEMPDAVYSEYWNNSWTKSYSYDSLGRLYGNNTKTQAGNWLQSYYHYKTISGKRTSTQVSKLETKIADFTYTYDNRGNITSVSDGTYTVSYAYDNLDQLIRENNPKINRTYVYTYSNGNITSRKEYTYTTGVLGSVLKTDTWTYGDSSWGDVLTKYNNVSTNAQNGRITSLAGNNLTYLDVGRLASAGNATYTYDTSGKRLSKTVNGVTTNFYYAGDLLVGQKTGNDIIEFMFDSNGDYFGFEYNGTPYYYIKNLQGDVIAICDNAGNTVVTYEYDAWGRLMSYTDITGFSLVTKNPIRYRGYYLDHETGFYYLKSRYYSAELCRFLSPDVYVSTGQGILGYNMFAYCNNNPICYCDSEGQRPIDSLSVQSETAEQRNNSFIYMSYQEHSKKGTTNPSNRNKHEQGQSRKNRDNHNEKGDARRKNRSNKRHFVYGDYSTDFAFNDIPIDNFQTGTVVVGCVVAIAYVLSNDITGVGVVDDVAVIPFVKTIWDVLT